jgi:hypothetical protein
VGLPKGLLGGSLGGPLLSTKARRLGREGGRIAARRVPGWVLTDWIPASAPLPDASKSSCKILMSDPELSTRGRRRLTSVFSSPIADGEGLGVIK